LSRFANATRAIFIKDLVTELRTKQLLPTQICLGLLIAWIFRIATEAAIADEYKSTVAAALLPIAILLSAIWTSDKSFAIEQQNDCISSLLLAPVDAGHIYVAKLLVNITILCVFEIVTVPVILMLFKVSIANMWLELIVVILLANIGIAGIGTLLGCVVQGTRAASSLLTILVMATLCPLMIPTIFALLSLFGTLGQSVGGASTLAMVGNFKTAIGYMTAFDAIFVTICWLLFGLVVQE